MRGRIKTAKHKQSLKQNLAWSEAAEHDRTKRLFKLENDKDFVFQTHKIKQDLLNVKRMQRALFWQVFPRLSPLLFSLGQYKKSWFQNVRDANAQRVFRSYIQYAFRFKVKLVPTKRSFRCIPFGPPSDLALHAEILGGHLRSPEREEPIEPLHDYLYVADKASISEHTKNIPELDELLQSGNARLVRVDSPESKASLLKELEYLAYDPARLTFVIHNAETPRIYCLVGEAVATDIVWHKAGKVITALQKALYGREKAGRPANMARLKRALRGATSSKSSKQQAHATQPTPQTETDLESRQRYLRRIKTRAGHRKNSSA